MDDLGPHLTRLVFAAVLYRNALMTWDEFEREVTGVLGLSCGREFLQALPVQWYEPEGRGGGD